MDKIVFDSNKEIEENHYFDYLKDFRCFNDKSILFNEYKNHNMRFCLLIRRDIALRNNDTDFAFFINSVIDSMTSEIVLLNNSCLDNTIDSVLNDFNFHEKVNIIFYVRDNFYDKSFDSYDVLSKEAYDILAASIVVGFNEILSDYKLSLDDFKAIDLNEFKELINDDELFIDLMFASELVK